MVYSGIIIEVNGRLFSIWFMLCLGYKCTINYMLNGSFLLGYASGLGRWYFLLVYR